MPSGKKRKQKPKPAPAAPQAKRDGGDGEDFLDPQQWISSDSEPEDYGDLNGKERWEIDGVVDSHCGENDRMSYKIRWNKNDWRRKDGTSEEWIPAPRRGRAEHQTLIKQYEARQYDERDTSEINPVDEAELMPFLVGPPFVSKNLWLQAGLGSALAKHQEDRNGSPRQAGLMIFDINDRNFARGEFDSSESEDEPPPPPPSQPKQEPESEPPRLMASPSLGGSLPPSQNAASNEPTPLQMLADAWSKAAEKIGAARITLTNESNTPDALPKLKNSFQYSEADLEWGSGVEGYSFDDDMFASCRCDDQCDRPHACGCQDPLFETHSQGPRALHKFAYNSKGLFRLDHQGVVIECNKRCFCSSNCPNRIAQQPRSVPIDIFTPAIQGWGVRAHRSIKAGQVLGTFTGEIVPREKAEDTRRYVAAKEMSTGNKVQFDDRNHYLFDLDARHKNYSLDCWRFGNWARFINHHCEPNMKIYPVCYDTLPETGLERLAIVATRDIRAREELTIDYHPSNEPGSVAAYPRQLSICRCGAQNCRGVSVMVGD